MRKYYPQTVIMGTELTGLLTSIALSKAGLPHTLIGSPTTEDLFHHGEMLSMVGTVAFLQTFPELMEYAYDHKMCNLYVNNYSVNIDFSHVLLTPFRAFMHTFGNAPLKALLAIDRRSVGQAVYEKAIHSPYCTHLDKSISTIDYEPNTDRIKQLTLQDGTELPISHLFDATGHQCAVAKKVGLNRQTLDEPYYFIHAYYDSGRDDGRMRLPQAHWHEIRTGIRLYREEHGLNAFVVPLCQGNRLSLRISIAVRELDEAMARGVETSEEALLTFIEQALSRHTIAYRNYYPYLRWHSGGTYEHYVYERAFGRNWLLTGNAYCNSLGTTAISLDTSFDVLHVGGSFTKHPERIGKLYQKHNDYYLKIQETWRWLMTHKRSTFTVAEAHRNMNQYVWLHSRQFFHSLHTQFYDSPYKTGFELLNRCIDNDLLTPVTNIFTSTTGYEQ